eukprot:CAMPEP_0119303250 /NCGR_PEP_ID=MMETSP1333-20130426/4708_1 /TAXON_ID=418940 /ORGANISM="Scyphosphaera apsteinii, Strain RCC1455" /LENGTH=378 /DNA_ID=CAMNT_0007305867 /DNA_START=272 /DNA_END=1408 /DNA_ORIENTATION=-
MNFRALTNKVLAVRQPEVCQLLHKQLFVAAVAMLRRIVLSQLAQLQSNAGGNQDGAKVSAKIAWASSSAEAQAMAMAALDARAIETLRDEGCVHKADFLCTADASALYEELCELERNGNLESNRGIINNAPGRLYFDLSAKQALQLGAPVLSRTLEALSALAMPLTAASTVIAKHHSVRRRIWWGTAEAPTRGVVQLYPPGSHYPIHTDTHHTFNGWSSPRSFTAIVYAHEGWQPEHGGQLQVYGAPAAFRSTTGLPELTAPRTVIEPRGGMLALFPAHLHHEVMPVIQRKRFCVSVWISLSERALQPGPALELAAERTSEAWIMSLSHFNQLPFPSDGILPSAFKVADEIFLGNSAAVIKRAISDDNNRHHSDPAQQ